MRTGKHPSLVAFHADLFLAETAFGVFQIVVTPSDLTEIREIYTTAYPHNGSVYGEIIATIQALFPRCKVPAPA